MKKRAGLLLLVFLLLTFGNELFAQCAMCKVVAEEAMKNGSSQGEGINKAVLFIFCMPYLIVGTIGFLWWRKREQAKNSKKVEVK